MMTMRTALMSLLLSATVAVNTTAQAQQSDAVAQALEALDAALPGDLLHNPFDMEWESKGNDIRTKMVDAAALTSGKAISARIKKKQTRAWDSGLSVEIPEAVNAGEEVQIFFWARTKKAAAGKDTADIGIFVGRNEEPYDYILTQDIRPDTEWKLMNVTGVANADYPAGSLKVEYQLGRAVQTVEFGPIYVSSLGQKDLS